MTKTLISLAVASLGLAACTNEPVAPAPTPVVINTQPAIVTAPPAGGTVVVPQATVPGQVVVVPAPTAALRAGYGRIESISAVVASASSGGSVPQVSADDVRRFAVRMEDGTVQFVDARAPNLAVGNRVEITRDGYIRSPI
jgi:hypothetical protein